MRTKSDYQDVPAGTPVVAVEPITAPVGHQRADREWVEAVLADGRVVEMPASRVTVHDGGPSPRR